MAPLPCNSNILFQRVVRSSGLVVQQFASTSAASTAPHKHHRIYPSTSIPIDKQVNVNINIDRYSKLIFIGSCFASNVAAALKLRKFSPYANPQGIQFNPASIAQTLHNCTSRYVWTRSDLSCSTIGSDTSSSNGSSSLDTMYSFHHHSSFMSLRGGDVEGMLSRMTAATHQAADALSDKNAVLFITLGTTKVYHCIETNQIVSNCHKEPNSRFIPRFLSVTECETILEEALLPALQLNKHLKVVFTISPIRHTRDGMVSSSRSKASLVTVVDALIARHPDRLTYFPAYEIMMDELRDYRWYEEDMVHPSAAAVEYIYHRFEETFMSHETVQLSEKIIKLNGAINHRPMLASSPAHRKHLQHTLDTALRIVNNTSPTLADFNQDGSFDSDIQCLRHALATVDKELEQVMEKPSTVE